MKSINHICLLNLTVTLLLCGCSSILQTTAGDAAITACNSFYVSKMDKNFDLKKEVETNIPSLPPLWAEIVFPPLALISQPALTVYWLPNLEIINQVNEKSVVAGVEGSAKSRRKAKYLDHLGCSLIPASDPVNQEAGLLIADVEKRKQVFVQNLDYSQDSEEAWPQGNGVTNDSSEVELQQRLAKVINEHITKNEDTRQITIVHNGKLLIDQAQKGFDKNKALPGESMSKSVLAMLLMMQVDQDKLHLTDKAFPNFAYPKSEITLADLLFMRTVLNTYDGLYLPWQSVDRMIFYDDNVSAYAEQAEPVPKLADYIEASDPIEKSKHISWSYQSAYTNYLSYVLKNSFTTLEEYWDFAYSKFFKKIGATSAVFETDAQGTFIGSTFLNAAAHDWARFGQLLLNKGKWNGADIIKATSAQVLHDPDPVIFKNNLNHGYGGQIWLSLDESTPNTKKICQQLPSEVTKDSFFFLGHYGQMVAVLPKLDIVIVRLGLSTEMYSLSPFKWWDDCGFLKQIVDVVKPLNSSE